MTTATTTTVSHEPHGVPIDTLRGTIAKLTDNPDLAAFRFTARNSWVEGTATRSTIHEWYGVATTAANREITLTRIETTVRGSIDVRGVLGIDPDVRNGFSSVTVDVDIDGDAPRDALDALIVASTKRSAVFDIVTAPTSVIVRPAA